jgi:hypothetical protein
MRTMNRKAQKALADIRRCVATGRWRVLAHFTRRMDERGLFWPDILSVLTSPAAVLDDGPDDFGRPKWKLAGRATDGLKLEIVCALDTDAAGRVTVFITVYWK